MGRTGRAAKTGDAFTFITREDEALVRTIESVLGEKVERRKLDGFDYSKPRPAHDSEFARPPRQPQPRRGQKDAGSSRDRTGTHAAKKGHPAKPAQGTTHRGSVHQQSSGTAARRTRSHKSGSGH